MKIIKKQILFHSHYIFAFSNHLSNVENQKNNYFYRLSNIFLNYDQYLIN